MGLIGRLRADELTPRRVLDALVRRAKDLPDALAWQLGPFARENRRRLAAFRDLHRGERCVILANGPSLGSMDLSSIADVPTFGMNRIYLLFNQLPFQPTYYVAINQLVLEQFAHEIGGLSMPRFLAWGERSRFDPHDPQIAFLRTALGLVDRFSRDVAGPIHSGGTVTFAALQLAFHMGFEEVVLVGLDHRFAATGTPNRTEVRVSEEDQDHFHPQYFPRGSRWQLPDLVRSELAYRAARRAFEQSGRRIVDATPGGACPVFERGDFEALF